jgi:ADP-ribosylglycohydrolase
MIETSRYRGALLGLAAGDALGTTLEFQPPGSFTLISDMLGGGPFDLQPGEWTDDTAMALCLAESLVEAHGFDAYDQMERYVRWWREGYYSVKGYCFDIGSTVEASLLRFQETGDPYAGSIEPDTAGNGSLMRLAPVPLAYAANPRAALEKSAESSRTTHGAPQAVDACLDLGGLLVGAATGASKDELVSDYYAPVPDYWNAHPLHPAVEEIAAGSFRRRNPPDIHGRGYVVSTLEAALWAFYTTNTFEEGCLKVINLGDDADTTGAVFGQLAGAFYGEHSIPNEWRAKLAMRERIEELADGLLALAHVLQHTE